MSAQVTEAHQKLAYELMQMDDRLSAFANRTAAQLIADSEAKAVAEWQESVYLKGDAIDSLLIECDRLRAETKSCGELSRDECNARTAALIAERDQLRAIFPQICEALGNGSCCAPDVSLDFLQSIPNEVAGVVANLRAEVERLTKQRDNLLKPMRDQAIARAERAEAELAAANARAADWARIVDDRNAQLAAERARLDAVVANCWAVHSEGGSSFWVFSNVCGDYIATAQTYRAAIDAAMKEETK